jgi:hypothetical protein
MPELGDAVTVEGPDCVECHHYADWHHLAIDGRYHCICGTCPNYVGELHGDGQADG